MSDAIGLELERREMEITFEFACRDDCLGKMVPSDLRQVVAERDRLRERNEALEAAATDVVECGVDAMAYDRRQVLDALAALLEATTDRRAG